jgi:hypothetical protein
VTEDGGDDDLVRRFLRARGCSEAVVDGGTTYLFDQWQQTAASIERGYDGDVDDYLNDMDVRQILWDLWSYVSKRGTPRYDGRLLAIDERVRPLLVPARGCLWGESNATKHEWTAKRNWWYFTHPRRMGEALRDDLARRQLLHLGDTR